MSFKIGDAVSLVYSQPGNDVTHVLVTAVSDDGAWLDAYDYTFEFDVRKLCAAKCWLTTDAEFAGRLYTRKGEVFTIRELMERYLNEQRTNR